MKEGRKLILHMGSHKTGTTSIQSALYHCKDKLKEQGISLFNFELDGTERENGNALPWIGFDRDGKIEGSVHPRLAEELGRMPGDVIFSAEHLSWIVDPEIIQSFHRNLTKYFDVIQLVTYLRRQDRQAISHYQQGSKPGGQPAFRYYDGSARALPEYRSYFQRYLNYDDKMARWADVFGDENVDIRVFERDRLFKGDAVSDFFHTVGIRCTPPPLRENETDGFERTKVGHLMGRAGVPPGIRRRLRGALDNAGKLLPARADAESFYAHFRESNLRLNQRFKISDVPHIFSDDFDMYPREACDTWTEESANQAIRNVLNGLASLPVISDQELLRLKQAAISLAEIDEAGARKLERIVTRYEPGFTLAIDRPPPPPPPPPPPIWRRAARKVRRALSRIFRGG
jgi:hypothetical protein